jgi:phosphoribosylformylglycinamidine synthase
MAEACRAFEVPVVSGNVSLYNQTEERAIHPTPTVAMVGRVVGWNGADDGPLAKGRTASFERAGDAIVLLGSDRLEMGGSAYARLLHGCEQGKPPEVVLEEERRLHALLIEAHLRGWVEACHDVSTGGLAVALAESCFARGLGAELEIPGPPLGLFSESQGRAFVALAPDKLDDFLRLAEEHAVAAVHAGSVGGDSLRIRFDGGVLDQKVHVLWEAWHGALPAALGM